MSTLTDPALLDVPGLIRRVRRTCDLSQADLAARLGVCQSTVARWETGGTEPSLSMFQRLIALAGYTIEIWDPAAGEPVPPMRADGARDRRGRRYPAHLDVLPLRPHVCSHPEDPEPSQWAPRRCRRDERRIREDHLVPADHLSGEEVQVMREAYREVHHKRHLRKQRLQREWTRHMALLHGEPHPDLQEPCFCPDECFGHPGCPVGCPCRCEPMTEDPPPLLTDQEPLFA